MLHGDHPASTRRRQAAMPPAPAAPSPVSRAKLLLPRVTFPLHQGESFRGDDHRQPAGAVLARSTWSSATSHKGGASQKPLSRALQLRFLHPTYIFGVRAARITFCLLMPSSIAESGPLNLPKVTLQGVENYKSRLLVGRTRRHCTDRLYFLQVLTIRFGARQLMIVSHQSC